MKKTFKQLTTGLALLISAVTFSQVGINTAAPHASADLELASTNKTLYLNRVADPGADVADPQEGMVLYDTTMKCLRAYQGDPAEWSGCLDGGDGNGGLEGTVTSLDCAGATFNPASAVAGQPYSGTLTIPYTGGNGGIYAAQNATVNGLTFDLPLGVFAVGDGNVVYNVTGTPVAAGTTTISVTIGGQSCSGANAISLTVNPATGNPTGVLPGTVTLAQNSRYFIASVYDNDYLPYTAPTGPASTAVVNAGGGTDTLVDILGTINTTGITVYIPATVTGTGGNVAAWSSIITVPAHLTQNGVATQVQLSWAAQTLTATSTSLVATIKAVGGALEAKKLDINAGIGNDYLGLLLGTFQYPYNSTGTLTNYELRDIPGIPDRMFGQIDNAGMYQHNFLYLPVTAEDGKVWLNNNLGANYANVDHSAFNLTQQATSDTDKNAMGSLLHWGRKADAHELVDRDSYSPVFRYGFVAGTVPTWSPTEYRRIMGNFPAVEEWTSVTTPPPGDRWLPSSPNNPCPQGFKVPLAAEVSAVRTAAGAANLYSTTGKLKLTRTGVSSHAQGGGDIFNLTKGYYWMADGYTAAPSYRANCLMDTTVYTSNIGNDGLTQAKAVRCIQQ